MDQGTEVRLVFAGEILEGFQPEEVKRRFGERLKLTGAPLAKLFSGQRIVLKRSIPAPEAVRYVLALNALGAKIYMEPLDATPVASAPAPNTASVNTLVSAPAVATSAVETGFSANLVPMEETITCPNCGEVQPVQVYCRSCTTDMPRGIASRKEDAERARAQRLEAHEVPALPAMDACPADLLTATP